MISSVLGAVIMSAATVSMLIALKITNETFLNVGRQPLSQDEKRMLFQAGFNTKEEHNIINDYIKELTFEWRVPIQRK